MLNLCTSEVSQCNQVFRCKHPHAGGAFPPRISRHCTVNLQASPSEARGVQGETLLFFLGCSQELPHRFSLASSGGGATCPCLCDWPDSSSQATPGGRAQAPSGGGATHSCLCDWPVAAGRCDDRATGGNRFGVLAQERCPGWERSSVGKTPSQIAVVLQVV